MGVRNRVWERNEKKVAKSTKQPISRESRIHWARLQMAKNFIASLFPQCKHY